MAEKTPGKHVIFLGAGASASSGYPLANELRLRLSSWERFSEFVGSNFSDDADGGTGVELARRFWSSHGQAIEIFRHGGFASVDEFCQLAAGSKDKLHIEAVRGMRALTRLALGLHNPERKFEASEYYGFVQRLYDASLCKLRTDTVVLSYNYDPYLEYLLLKAQHHRAALSGCSPTPDEYNAMCGGFHDVGSWVNRGGSGTGFAVLKLHGCITTLSGSSNGDMFAAATLGRLTELAGGSQDAFIAFPWELFDEGGNYTAKDSFPKIGINGWAHDAFRATWERARREVTEATKVSFVGLSMHPYLERGLRFLFANRKHPPPDIVVANRDAEISEAPGVANSYTRTIAMLHKAGHRMMNAPAPSPFKGYKSRVRADFQEFIDHEMD